jgi:hypothetical protein
MNGWSSRLARDSSSARTMIQFFPRPSRRAVSSSRYRSSGGSRKLAVVAFRVVMGMRYRVLHPIVGHACRQALALLPRDYPRHLADVGLVCVVARFTGSSRTWMSTSSSVTTASPGHLKDHCGAPTCAHRGHA